VTHEATSARSRTTGRRIRQAACSVAVTGVGDPDGAGCDALRSIAELASRLDVAPSHVSRVIKGLVGLSVETCIRLADVLGEARASVLWACGHPHVAVLLFGDSTGTKPRARVRDTLDQLAKGDRRLIESLATRLSILAGLEHAPSAPAPPFGEKGGAERTR
jgi:transcriptional regulator with XRE-family HTH domain